MKDLPSDSVDEVVGTQVDITDHGRAVLDEEPLVSPTTGYSFNKSCGWVSSLDQIRILYQENL